MSDSRRSLSPGPLTIRSLVVSFGAVGLAIGAGFALLPITGRFSPYVVAFTGAALYMAFDRIGQRLCAGWVQVGRHKRQEETPDV